MSDSNECHKWKKKSRVRDWRVIGCHFRWAGLVREIISEEVVVNRMKLVENLYEYLMGNSISDTKNSLYKGSEVELYLSMFKDQQGGQNDWSTLNEKNNRRWWGGRSGQRPAFIKPLYLPKLFSPVLSSIAVMYFPEFLGVGNTYTYEGVPTTGMWWRCPRWL